MGPSDHRGEKDERRHLGPEALGAALNSRLISQPETLKKIKPGVSDRLSPDFGSQKASSAIQSVTEGAAKPAGTATAGIDLPVADLDHVEETARTLEPVDDKITAFLESGQGVQAGASVAIAVCQPPRFGRDDRSDGGGCDDFEKAGRPHVSSSACGPRHGQNR